MNGMPDREKVMTWLEICGKNNDCSGCCPYSENGFGEYGRCRESLMADAYELLKEQEQMYYTLEHDWKMCRELLKEQQEQIETLESLRRIEQEGR